MSTFVRVGNLNYVAVSVPRTDLGHRLNSKSDHRGAISNYTFGNMLFPVDI